MNRGGILPFAAVLAVFILAPGGCELEDEERFQNDFVVIPIVTIQTSGENVTLLEGVNVTIVAKKSGGHTVGGSCITNSNGACCIAFGFRLAESEGFIVNGQVTMFDETWTGFVADEQFKTPAEGGANYDQIIAHCGLVYHGYAIAPLFIQVGD